MINVDASVKWDSDKCRYESKKYMCEKDYIWNPVICSCENGKYLGIIIHDSIITCDEILEGTITIPTNFNEKKQPVKQKSSIFYFHFYWLP